MYVRMGSMTTEDDTSTEAQLAGPISRATGLVSIAVTNVRRPVHDADSGDNTVADERTESFE